MKLMMLLDLKIINFVTFKILIIKNTSFPHRNTDNTLRLTERRTSSSSNIERQKMELEFTLSFIRRTDNDDDHSV